MRKIGLILLLAIIGVALTWLGGQLGWWWVTPIVGAVTGVALRPTRLALVVSFIVGGSGWGLPLALLAFNAPLGRIATAVEGLIGLTATAGVVIILVTVLVGCILSIVGTWVSITGMRLLPASRF